MTLVQSFPHGHLCLHLFLFFTHKRFPRLPQSEPELVALVGQEVLLGQQDSLTLEKVELLNEF